MNYIVETITGVRPYGLASTLKSANGLVCKLSVCLGGSVHIKRLSSVLVPT